MNNAELSRLLVAEAEKQKTLVDSMLEVAKGLMPPKKPVRSETRHRAAQRVKRVPYHKVPISKSLLAILEAKPSLPVAEAVQILDTQGVKLGKNPAKNVKLAAANHPRLRLVDGEIQKKAA